jgi:hypothetical protein
MIFGGISKLNNVIGLVSHIFSKFNKSLSN